MLIVMIALLVGILGTCFGSALAVMTKKFSENMTNYLLAFAGGVMMSLVFFDLMPEALEASNVWIVVGGILIGLIAITILDTIVKKITVITDGTQDSGPKNQKSILKSGIVMLIAVGIHNIPAGIAIGAGGAHDAQIGVMMALMFALHNIPEGMALSAPLSAGGVKGRNVVLLASLSGAPTLIGAVIGMLIGNISDGIMVITLSGIGGIMLYMIFVEIIPEAIETTKSRFLMLTILLGVLVGFVVMSY